MNIKKKKGGEGGANWMDTYGDMVTLLLCFFVLLYSMSTIDEKKWQMIVMSFNPNVTSVPAQSIPQGPVGSNSSGGRADRGSDGRNPERDVSGLGRIHQRK
jgi:chemotaxis protein MotB